MKPQTPAQLHAIKRRLHIGAKWASTETRFIDRPLRRKKRGKRYHQALEARQRVTLGTASAPDGP